jgi:hypothetical protein
MEGASISRVRGADKIFYIPYTTGIDCKIGRKMQHVKLDRLIKI